MAKVTHRPKKKRKGLGTQKKCYCGITIQFYESDPHWTEYGNTYARCPECKSELFVGRLGRADT